MDPVLMTRPLPVRLVAGATLLVITTWALVTGEAGGFGVLAYPAIIGLQTYREWVWRLEVSPDGIRERPGVGAPRELRWREIAAVLMPDAAWWRVNPALQVSEGPNIQLTAAPEIAEIIAIARRRRLDVVGDVGTVSLLRTLAPWLVLLALACLLLGAEVAAGTG